MELVRSMAPPMTHLHSMKECLYLSEPTRVTISLRYGLLRSP
jgi:hypothetical protein